jgi:2-iminobutanoate/2-iminopropanoate deaminase
MTPKKTVSCEKGPKAIGPYCQAVQSGRLVFTSGQLGLDPSTGELTAGGVEAETRQALANLAALLEACGSGLPHAVKTTVYLREMADFARMNAVYAEFFVQDPPARSTVQAAALPKGAAVEIECIAEIPSA